MYLLGGHSGKSQGDFVIGEAAIVCSTNRLESMAEPRSSYMHTGSITPPHSVSHPLFIFQQRRLLIDRPRAGSFEDRIRSFHLWLSESDCECEDSDPGEEHPGNLATQCTGWIVTCDTEHPRGTKGAGNHTSVRGEPEHSGRKSSVIGMWIQAV